MNKSYKITFLDKKKFRIQLCVIVFFSVLYIAFIVMTIYNMLNSKSLYLNSIFAIIIGLIAIPSTIYKYNKKDLSYFIANQNSIYYRTFFGKKLKELYWNDVKEARIGRFKFFGIILETIYVSTNKLTDKEKYKLMKYGAELKTEVLLIPYSKEALYAIEEFYGGKILINIDEDD